MRKKIDNGKTKNAGFISTRLAGMDGVSMETKKWGDIFEKEGFNCFFMASELDFPAERSFVVEKAHFTHPEIKEIYKVDHNYELGLHQYSYDILRQKIKGLIMNFFGT